MPRNLDHRIEVVVPVEDLRVANELVSVLDTLLADNSQAWLLEPDGTWRRIVRAPGEKMRATHSALMKRARQRTRRRTEIRRPR